MNDVFNSLKETNDVFGHVEINKMLTRMEERAKGQKAMIDAFEAVQTAETEAKKILTKDYLEKTNAETIALWTNAWKVTADESTVLNSLFAGKKNHSIRQALQPILGNDAANRMARQVWRSKISAHIIHVLGDNSDTIFGQDEKVLKIMEAQKMSQPYSPAQALLDASRVHEDFDSQAKRAALSDKMNNGYDDVLFKNLFKQHGDYIKEMHVLTGGALLKIHFQYEQAHKFIFKNFHFDAAKKMAYAQLQNGCEGNMVIIKFTDAMGSLASIQDLQRSEGAAAEAEPAAAEPAAEAGAADAEDVDDDDAGAADAEDVDDTEPAAEAETAAKAAAKTLEQKLKADVLRIIAKQKIKLFPTGNGSGAYFYYDGETIEHHGKSPWDTDITWEGRSAKKDPLQKTQDDEMLKLLAAEGADVSFSGKREKVESVSKDPSTVTEGDELKTRAEIRTTVHNLAVVGKNRYDIQDTAEFERFLMTIIHLESTFDKTRVSGAENQDEAGYGLTQLTGPQYTLEDVSVMGDAYSKKMGSKGDKLSVFGSNWIDPSKVSTLRDRHNVHQNISRFITGYAGPAFQALKSQTSGPLNEARIWEQVAFHWRKDVFTSYNEDDTEVRSYDKFRLKYYLEDEVKRLHSYNALTIKDECTNDTHLQDAVENLEAYLSQPTNLPHNPVLIQKKEPTQATRTINRQLYYVISVQQLEEKDFAQWDAVLAK